MREIKFPTEKTYFIAYTNDRLCAWGSVETNQEMSTGQPNLYSTTNENEWMAELQNYNVVWGYQFNDEESALQAKEDIDQEYGEGTAIVNHAEYNTPKFWYILGDFPIIEDDPTSFQVFPN